MHSTTLSFLWFLSLRQAHIVLFEKREKNWSTFAEYYAIFSNFGGKTNNIWILLHNVA